MSQADLVRLLPWFCSTTAKSGACATHSVSEALTSITTSELEGTTPLALMSSTVHRINTLPPVPLALDILAAGTPVGHSPLVSNVRIGTAPPAAHLKVKVAKGHVLALRREASAVGAVLCLSSW